MDPVPPAPPISTPPVAPLPEQKNKIWLWIVGGILLLGTGIVSGVFLGKQLYSQPVPQPTPLPPEASAKEGDPTATWKTYTNTKYNFSLKHPDLNSTCCNISGPIIGEPENIIVLADSSTTTMGTDKPFDGLGVFVDTTEIDLNKEEGFASYIYGQKNSLIDNYREFVGQEPTSLEDKSTTIGGINGTVLKGYAWWGEMTYLPLPRSQKIFVLVKTESSKDSFDTTFNLILSTFKFLGDQSIIKTCLFNGIEYKDGEGFKNDCNSCFCSGGNIACTLIACP